jgi:hypothetical protein
MRTQRIERDEKGVLYIVLEDGRVIWNKFVKFGRKKADRPGGASFRQASAEAAHIAMETHDEKPAG